MGCKSGEKKVQNLHQFTPLKNGIYPSGING